MANPIQLPRVRRRWHGPQLWKVIGLVGVVVAVSVTLLYYGHGLWFKTTPKKVASGTGQTVEHTAFVKASANGTVPGMPQDKEALKREEALRQALEASRKANEALMARLEAMNQDRANGREEKADAKKTEHKPERKIRTITRAPLHYVSTPRQPLTDAWSDRILTPGTKIPCSVESVIHSEIQGAALLTTKRVVKDALTGQRDVIPQGQEVVAHTETENLLFGNERIPLTPKRLALPGGKELDLRHAVIMDGEGRNGLTGIVDNHVWRIVWTSVLGGSLAGGRQVLLREMGQQGAGVVGAHVAKELGQGSQQYLNRAQDTRPTIEVQAGDACNIVLAERVEVP